MSIVISLSKQKMSRKLYMVNYDNLKMKINYIVFIVFCFYGQIAIAQSEISGIVYSDTINIETVDSAIVKLISSDGTVMDSVITDQEGEFEVSVPERNNKFFLVVEKPDFMTYRLEFEGESWGDKKRFLRIKLRKSEGIINKVFLEFINNKED